MRACNLSNKYLVIWDDEMNTFALGVSVMVMQSVQDIFPEMRRATELVSVNVNQLLLLKEKRCVCALLCSYRSR